MSREISIFGLGYVGTVSGACLAKRGHRIVGVDKSVQKVAFLQAGLSPIVETGIDELIAEAVAAGRLRATSDPEEAVRETDVSLVSVGTPSARDGSLALEAADAVTREIGRALRHKPGDHTVVYRSTVLPGTTERRFIPLLEASSGRRLGEGLEVCYNPEFLREGSAVLDFHRPPFIVAGSGSEAGSAVLAEIYEGIEADFIETGLRTAEAVKYISNMFHALKVCFANEVGAALKEMGVDGRKAMEIFCRDTILNISAAYLRPGYAFGGSCLPKDLRAFLHRAKILDVEMPLLAQLLPSNGRHIDRAFDLIAQNGRGRIALFGLAFKGGTDDLRESPLVTLSERLIGKGYELRIFDPDVNTARLMGANREFIEREIPHIDRLMQPDVRSTLEGADAVVLGKVGRSDLEAIVSLKPDVPVIDLQGGREVAGLRARDYRGICW
ncbi:MAG TPA: nucleotide sugar dehydrogenase [Thermoanaerobaculia bacterium]|nr:nucleotide sugar dehydrogenase [Thermoanaerobaculia bacterium]